MISKILLLSSVVLLTGCSMFREPVKEIVTQKVEVSKPALNLSNPEALKLQDVKWIVVTQENAEEVFTELQNSGQPIAIFGLTAEGYEALSMNIAEIKTYIGTQKEIIIQYRDYYEGENNAERESEQDQ